MGNEMNGGQTTIEEYRTVYSGFIRPLIVSKDYSKALSLVSQMNFVMKHQKDTIAHFFDAHCGSEVLSRSQILEDRLNEGNEKIIVDAMLELDAYFAQTKLPKIN